MSTVNFNCYYYNNLHGYEAYPDYWVISGLNIYSNTTNLNIANPPYTGGITVINQPSTNTLGAPDSWVFEVNDPNGLLVNNGWILNYYYGTDQSTLGTNITGYYSGNIQVPSSSSSSSPSSSSSTPSSSSSSNGGASCVKFEIVVDSISPSNDFISGQAETAEVSVSAYYTLPIGGTPPPALIITPVYLATEDAIEGMPTTWPQGFTGNAILLTQNGVGSNVYTGSGVINYDGTSYSQTDYGLTGMWVLTDPGNACPGQFALWVGRIFALPGSSSSQSGVSGSSSSLNSSSSSATCDSFAFFNLPSVTFEGGHAGSATATFSAVWTSGPSTAPTSISLAPIPNTGGFDIASGFTANDVTLTRNNGIYTGTATINYNGTIFPPGVATVPLEFLVQSTNACPYQSVSALAYVVNTSSSSSVLLPSSSSNTSPSSSSMDAQLCNTCVRIIQPRFDTIEQYNPSTGALTITWQIYKADPRQIAALLGDIPSTGLDTMVVNYASGLGQEGQIQRNVNLWATDGGWAYLGVGGKKQYLVSGIDGRFFDSYALAINQRNVLAGIQPLQRCCNEGFGYVRPIRNQHMPRIWIRDGVFLSGDSLTSCDETTTTYTQYNTTPQSSSYVENQQLSGLVNGVNTVFLLPFTPATGTGIQLYAGGVRMTPGFGNDYMLVGATVTFFTAPTTGPIVADGWAVS